MSEERFYNSNFDAKLINCTKTGFISYSSCNNDPQFIFQNVHAGTYIIRLKLKFKEIANGSIEIFWAKSMCDFVEDKKISILAQHDSQISAVLIIDQTSAVRIDPINTNMEFKLELSLIACSPEYGRQKMIESVRNKPYQCKDYNNFELFSYYREDLKSKIKCEDDGFTRYDEFRKMVDSSLQIKQKQVNKLMEGTIQPAVFSIIIPTYNTNPDHLIECIQSIVNQSYSKWEICIVDDASTKKETVQTLQSLNQKYPNYRINIKYRSENGHICRASNDALSMAKGDYIVLVDHDDLIHPDALYWIAKCISEHPKANLIYTDEDKLCEETGMFISPHFKPAFNLDLLLSYNYICHLSCFRKSIVDQINGFRPGFEGSQDYDLILRVVSNSNRNQIIHIPIPLYHWRIHPESTANSPGAKDYTSLAGLRAIQDFLDDYYSEQTFRTDCRASIIEANRYRVQRILHPKNIPSVELIIPTKDRSDILNTAIESIFKSTYTNFSITIVNNQSIESETYELFNQLENRFGSRVKILGYNETFNYSAINNFAAKQSKADIIGLVNNDVEVINPDWLSEMVSLAVQEDVGCVGAKLYYSDGSIQHAGVIVGIGGVAGHSHKFSHRTSQGYHDRLKHPQELTAVTAACLIVRREVFNMVGGLNEDELKVAFNDVDFCLRVHQAGYRNIWTPYAELYHHESISRGAEDSPEKIRRFNSEVNYMLSKWAPLNSGSLPTCPHYSPYLNSKREDFSLSCSVSSTVQAISEMPFRTNISNHYAIIRSPQV